MLRTDLANSRQSIFLKLVTSGFGIYTEIFATKAVTSMYLKITVHLYYRKNIVMVLFILKNKRNEVGNFMHL